MSLKNSMKAKAMTCVSCLVEFVNLPDRPPSPGDVILCENCGKLYILSGGLALIEMTAEMEHVFNLKYPSHAKTVEEIRTKIRHNSRLN